mmetsp:Transcript_14482/g.31412  ORF Transcript_14482/g.31412 Transcript_14482/m.31412 type:complete len:216 (+) Transcript_14482:160-807(+)
MIRALISSLLFDAASAGFVGHHTGLGTQPFAVAKSTLKMSDRQEEMSAGYSDQHDAAVVDDSRRRALGIITTTLPSVWASHAATSFAAKLRPDDAFASLVKAQKELQVAGADYLPKKDWDGLRAYLAEEAVNMNSYDANAQALLESKRLDAESKKDIGTIRRYGVGADVIIMYGGLKNEVDEENENPSSAEIGKYLRRTEDALGEVIAICRSNGF